MRKDYKEIQKIAKKLSCTNIFSWSKLNTYERDTYEYLLKYILKIPEDRKDSIYAISGSVCHTIIEQLYDNKIKYEDMLEAYEDELFKFNLSELKYDRSDEEKNKKIGDKYEACLRHFFINHQKIKCKPKIEMFIPIKIDNIMIQGYIDFIHKEKRDDKEYIIVTDWKTSSIYKGEKLNSEKGQLELYGLGIHQKLNIPLDQIIVRWAFLKYVNVNCLQANGNWKTRTIERNDIGNSLTSSVKMWLKKSDTKPTEEEIEGYILQIMSDNSIDCLPDDVKDKFIINDCYVEIPLTKETIEKLKEDIIKIVKEINVKEEEYNKTKDENIFWQEVTDKDSYFMNCLSGYSSKLHKPYHEYIEQKEMFKNNEKELEINIDENDMSWLEGLLD
jgi:hypothetical protein